jgi:hypothetical protein
LRCRRNYWPLCPGPQSKEKEVCYFLILIPECPFSDLSVTILFAEQARLCRSSILCLLVATTSQQPFRSKGNMGGLGGCSNWHEKVGRFCFDGGDMEAKPTIHHRGGAPPQSPQLQDIFSLILDAGLTCNKSKPPRHLLTQNTLLRSTPPARGRRNPFKGIGITSVPPTRTSIPLPLPGS